jgi:RNA polymerase sigma-70 factor (sigma-E family)
VARVLSTKVVIPQPDTAVTELQEALRAAFELHYPWLLRLCTALSGRRDVAEDIAQEAFVRIAPRIEQLTDEEIGPYLRRVAINLWKNRVRRFVVERRHREHVPASQPGEVEGVDEHDAVWQALLTLPDRQRACVVLRYYESLSEREIARALGCSVGTVKSHTSRAMARLRKELEP